MKRIIATILMLFALNSYAIEDDKKIHAAGSAVVAALAVPFFAESEHPVLYPFAVSFSLGVAKELYDTQKKNPTGFDVNDLAADAIGATIGSVGGHSIYTFAVPKGIGFGLKGKFTTSKLEEEK